MMDQHIKPVGAPPESLIFSGARRVEESYIRWTCYDDHSCMTGTLSDFNKLRKLDKKKRYWLDLIGIHDGELVGEICQFFNINKMIGEDAMNTHSRPKAEDYENLIQFSQKIPFLNKGGELEIHQLSIVLMSNVVVSFSEENREFFEPIYKRLQSEGSRMASSGSDYLAWALMDIGVDQTLGYIRDLENDLDGVESLIISSKVLPDISEVHVAHCEVASLYRILRPLKGVVQHFLSSDKPFVNESTKLYINDLLDHVNFAIESTEFLREHSARLQELYYTTTSHRMNEVMKVLAIVSTIFMPLSFLAGVYGMNFVNIPGMQNPMGFYILIGLFVFIVCLLVWMFKRKGWF